MSQEDLARLVGYKSRSSINKIELSREIPIRKVSQIADALGISRSYLMGYDPGESLTDEENQMLKMFRALSEKKRKMIMMTLKIAYDGREA